MKKYLLLSLFLVTTLVASLNPEKISNVLSNIESIPYIRPFHEAEDHKPNYSVQLFQAFFDHNDNLWFFWKEHRSWWRNPQRSNESLFSLNSSIFFLKVNKDGQEIVPKRLLYEGREPFSQPSNICIGSDNNLYLTKDYNIVCIDSTGNIIAESKNLVYNAAIRYIWIDTTHNKLYYSFDNYYGGGGLLSLDPKTLKVLNSLEVTKSTLGRNKGIPLPPNLKWSFYFYKDPLVSNEEYVAIDWFGPNRIIVCGLKNLGEGFVYKIDLQKRVLLDSFSFDIKKYSFKHYEQVTFPKIQFVKDRKEGFWVFIPFRYGRNEWVSVIKMNKKGKLVVPSKTIKDTPNDFNEVPTNMPKQALVNRIFDRDSSKTIEFDVDFFGFDMDCNLYHYKYRKKQ
jgi:hypothetical protein